jgi:nitroreductase
MRFEADVDALVTAGLLAPSADNCQPWRFAWDGRQLHVHPVAARGQSEADVSQAGLWLSLGAVLTNLHTLAQELGLRLEVRLFPGPGQPSDQVPAASIAITPAKASRQALVGALAGRCTNRRAYDDKPLSHSTREALTAAAHDTPGAQMLWLEDDPSKQLLAELAAAFDRILFESRSFHDALFRWMRWSPAQAERTRDGLPVGSLELHPLERPGFRALGWWPLAVLAKALGVTPKLPLRSRAVYRRSAAFGLLTVEGSAPADFVRGGEAFQRLWLTAGLRGLGMQPLGGLTFLVLRCQLQQAQGLSAKHQAMAQQIHDRLLAHVDALRGRTLVMAFRVGSAPPPTARSLRLPLEQVFTRLSGAPAHA